MLSQLLAVAPGHESDSLFFKGMFIVVFALIMYFSRDKSPQEIKEPE